MTLTEILFLTAAVLALIALFISVTDPKKSQKKPVKNDVSLPIFARGRDVEDAEIVEDRRI